MPATFVLGVLLGWLMIRSNNILLAILGHSLNNLMVLLTITYWQKINTHAIYLMNLKDKLILSALVVLFFCYINLSEYVVAFKKLQKR